MKVYFFIVVTLIGSLAYSCTVTADTDSPSYELEIGYTNTRQTGVTLGDAPLFDQLDTDEITIQFELKYPLNDQFFVFFGGELFDESETFKSSNTSIDASGLKLEGTGIGYIWGEDDEYQLEIGRIEYSDERQWWWDEYLDTIRLQFKNDDIEIMLATGSQQRPERWSDDFIDPEEQDINRLLTNVNWNLGDEQQLSFYFLSQDDGSASYALNDSIAEKKADESDADLQWFGLAYRGVFERESIGDIDWRIGYAILRGDEIVYDISDPVANIVTVDGIDSFDIDASAYEFSLDWNPAGVGDLTILYAYATGSGDSNLSDNRIDSFRQTGLQDNEADYVYYGELYDPELSNIKINSLGIRLGAMDDLDIALLMYHYRQDHADPEMRNVSIDLDPDGLDPDLGSEVDLIVIYEIHEELKLKVVTALFEAGDAYGANAGRNSRYWSIELDYMF